MSDERTICLICTRSAPSPHGTMTDGSPCPNASRPWPAPQASLPPQGAEPVSSIEAAQRHGYLGEPGEWREACRLYRARCTPGDCDKMAKLRTYIEEGLLVVVRPDRIAAPPQGASSLLPAGWVPLRIEWSPGYPEDVAFGPQIMMARLKKWLDKYFVRVAERATDKKRVAELLSSLDRQHGNCMIGHDKSRSDPSPYTDGIVKGFGEALRIVRMWADSLPESPAAEAPTREDGEAEAESNDPRDAVLGEALLTSAVGDTASPLPAPQEPAAYLYQHDETGRTTLRFPDDRLSERRWHETPLYAAPAPDSTP